MKPDAPNRKTETPARWALNSANPGAGSVQRMVVWPGWVAVGLWIVTGIIGAMIQGKEVPWTTYLSIAWGATVFQVGINFPRRGQATLYMGHRTPERT